jgi:DNA-directed RNA polymerase specialized sigma24 family protein
MSWFLEMSLPSSTLPDFKKTKAVRALVNSFPAKYREVVMLREFDELSMLEIAERLRCTVPTVKSRLFRGRSMLLAGVQELQAATPTMNHPDGISKCQSVIPALRAAG